MSGSDKDINLAGQFLIAMPGMGDPRFERGVIYMLAHDHEGAMGFVVNQPTDGLTLGEIASNLPDSVMQTGLRNLPVFVGGPVQPENGFVLYSIDDAKEAEQEGPVGVTQVPDILVQAAKTRAVVVVEHDMDFVQRLDCKVTVLHEGSVLAEGRLEHVTTNQDVIDVYLGR